MALLPKPHLVHPALQAAPGAAVLSSSAVLDLLCAAPTKCILRGYTSSASFFSTALCQHAPSARSSGSEWQGVVS